MNQSRTATLKIWQLNRGHQDYMHLGLMNNCKQVCRQAANQVLSRGRKTAKETSEKPEGIPHQLLTNPTKLCFFSSVLFGKTRAIPAVTSKNAHD